MRLAIATFCAGVAASVVVVFSQAPSRPRSDKPIFDVVSIKRHQEEGPTSNVIYQRADGGFSLTNVPASLLIARAYALVSSDDIVGLPAWAKTELYDVSATSSLSRATADERSSMWRSMLIDRFSLIAHLEKRSRPAYDLVLARTGGTLGPGLTRVAVDCEAVYKTQRAEAEAAFAAGLPWPPLADPDPSLSERRCALRLEPPDPPRLGWLLAGETTITELTASLRTAVSRMVVDKTGLLGSFRVRLIYDLQASRLGPEAALLPGSGPTVFAAVQQQLGLKLQSSRAEQDTLVVEHIERPSEN